MPHRSHPRTRPLALPALLLIAIGQSAAADEAIEVRTTIDFSADVGQPLGTIWEAVDRDGRPVAGAGFLSAYNTYHRSDRRQVHVYVRTSGDEASQLERLPRPVETSGTYLFSYDGTLYADARGGGDGRLRRERLSAEKCGGVDSFNGAGSVHRTGEGQFHGNFRGCLNSDHEMANIGDEV